jgi:thiamine-monophosphate kinase
MSDRPSEDDLIARYFAPLAGPGGLALRDDAALIAPPPECEIVVTVDGLVAGVHFFADDPPGSIARKALRVNLSDLAAKGSTSLGFLLTLALPRDFRADWLEAFAAALGADSRAFACPLLGGDTVSTPGPLTLSITAFGAVPVGRMVPRTGVRPGDFLYVSGTIGDAALGLWLRTAGVQDLSSRRDEGRSGNQSGDVLLDPGSPLRFGRDDRGGGDPDRAFLLDRYLHPQPRQALAPALLAHASGGMDVSDGLVGDLTKMLRVSGCSAVIDVARIPLSPAGARLVAARPDLLATALTGGDDYEILASVPPERAKTFEAAAKAAGVPVTRIGGATAGSAPPTFRDERAEPMSFARGSYSHF